MNVGEEILESGIVTTRRRIAVYVELLKPELTGLSVLTALCGFYLGSRGSIDLWHFFLIALGVTMVGGGAGALNQLIERRYDAEMKRTERRPLPAGRVVASEVFWYGMMLSLSGLSVLFLFINVLTGYLAALTLLSYLFVYTPLKRVTPLATIVGGVPGALPPVMGWAAATNEIELGAWVLFSILFFWQMPHFLSLGWMYRKDYARAGYRMLSALDRDGSHTSLQIVLFCIGLIPASLALTTVGVTGSLYSTGALILGISFLLYAFLFARYTGSHMFGNQKKTNFYSRQIFFASLVYLPVLMILMIIDRL